MITGYNTDVEYGGITYHIQTEDKGVDTPIILSLVYDRGTILAAKREPYHDLIENGFDEKVLAERLTKQHKVICAAVKKGRIDELKNFTQQKRNGKVASQNGVSPQVLNIAPAIESDAVLSPPIAETHSAVRRLYAVPIAPPRSAPSGSVPQTIQRIVAFIRPWRRAGQIAWRRLTCEML